MSALPNLAGLATNDLVEKIGGGNFSASYINWSRTMHLLRTHAPGWLPVLTPNPEGHILHRAPVGCYLLIKFRHLDGSETPPMPQAIMDSRNNAIPLEKVTARDITDTHRRGICMAAAMTFGLAYELWAKMPLESGYAEPEENSKGPLVTKVSPMDGALDGFDEEQLAFLKETAGQIVREFNRSGPEKAAALFYRDLNLDVPEQVGVWAYMANQSKARNQIKKFKDSVTTTEKAA
jgi:hypothetical protein